MQEKLALDMIRSINIDIANIKRIHGVNVLPNNLKSLSLENYKIIFSKVPNEIFSLRPPLFLDIIHLQSIDELKRLQ